MSRIYPRFLFSYVKNSDTTFVQHLLTPIKLFAAVKTPNSSNFELTLVDDWGDPCTEEEAEKLTRAATKWLNNSRF